MTDYSMYAIEEAAQIEILDSFVRTIREHDYPRAVKRLHAISMSLGSSATLTNIAARFNALSSCETSAD